MSQLNWNSRTLTSGWQPGVKSFFHGLNFSEDDFSKPQVGIGVPLLEGNLCNVHAYELARQVASGCRAADLLGFPFGTPAVSDNLTQGLEGGSASLVSRNLIATSAECVITAHANDAMIGLHHCDKNGPGFAMALARGSDCAKLPLTRCNFLQPRIVQGTLQAFNHVIASSRLVKVRATAK